MFCLTLTNVGKFFERGIEKDDKLICCFLRKYITVMFSSEIFLASPNHEKKNNKPLTECQEYSERCWSTSGNHRIVVAIGWTTSGPEPRLRGTG